MNTIKIINVETGEEIERPFNAEELQQAEKDKAAAEAAAAEIAAKEAARAELLARLGITADEAKLLLG